MSIEIAASRETVFDVIASPYDIRATRAMQAKVKVLERGVDMVLAAHYTPVRGWLQATTVETVRFRRPERIDFRLVRGPVPHVAETFWLREHSDATLLTYDGELGTDLWRLGRTWGDVVAPVAGGRRGVVRHRQGRGRAPRAQPQSGAVRC